MLRVSDTWSLLRTFSTLALSSWPLSFTSSYFSLSSSALSLTATLSFSRLVRSASLLLLVFWRSPTLRSSSCLATSSLARYSLLSLLVTPVRSSRLRAGLRLVVGAAARSG